MKRGVTGKNGLKPGFPPNTGVGWYSLSTGTWPGEHGSTNNTFHRVGEGNFNNSTSFATTGILQADHIGQAAERAGKTVVSMEWVGSRNLTPALQGPVVDFRTFIGVRGIALNYDLPGQPAGANAFGVQYQRIDLADAAGWTNVPASFSPAKQMSFTHNNAQIPGNGVWDVYIYDSTNNGTVDYDRVLIVNAADAKNGAMDVANLAQGEWADAKVTLATGTFAGRTAGFYAKLIDLTGDLSKVRIYFTSVQRANATYNALGPAGSTAFEEKLNRDFPTSTAADFAPMEAGIVDEDTYVEQGLAWKDAHWAYLEYILGPAPAGLGVKPDLALVGAPTTDEFQHQFTALVTKTDIDGKPNPYYDDLTNDNIPDGRVAVREGYIRSGVPGGRQHARARPRAGRPAGDDASSPPTTASRRSGTRSTSARCSSTSASRSASRAATAARPPTTRARRRRATRWRRSATPAARRRSTSTSPAATRRRATRRRCPPRTTRRFGTRSLRRSRTSTTRTFRVSSRSSSRS